MADDKRTKSVGAAQSALLSHGARAFAQCDGVVFSGSATAGKGLMAHELTHVVQSRPGQPLTLHLKGLKPDAATKAEMAAADGKTVRLDLGDPKAKGSAIQGRIRTTAPDEESAQQEWSIVFETIQRVR